nr:MAG TPA: hypothetical protein [Caudoviricetes sp.]
MINISQGQSKQRRYIVISIKRMEKMHIENMRID